MADAALGTLDRQILDILQQDVPLDPAPFAEVGRRVGTSEDEVLRAIRRLAQPGGVIRQISVNERGRPIC